MDAALEKKVRRFSALSRELRLQALLGYAKRFPALPAELSDARDRGLGRVEECQTPLYLWVGVEDGRVRIHADAPREAPTVRGFVGFLVESLDGADPAAVADVPEDLMDRMGLSDVLGVQRARGLGSVIRRIRRDVARAADEKSAS
jgi:cysteine desulfuration protein SufE